MLNWIFLEFNFFLRKIWENHSVIRGDTHMSSTLKEGKSEILSDVGGGGLASVLDVQSFFH